MPILYIEFGKGDRTMTTATQKTPPWKAGKAYIEAGRFADAIGPLTRALQLNRRMSKAYQLLGEAYEGAGQRDQAVAAVTLGVSTANELGDRVPLDAMADMLRKWGAAVPALAGEGVETVTADAATGAATSGFKCARCGRPDGQLPKSPFKGPLGQTVLDNTCSGCWREWIAMGTKVINELGLVLSTQAGQDTFDKYMIEFLQLEVG